MAIKHTWRVSLLIQLIAIIGAWGYPIAKEGNPYSILQKEGLERLAPSFHFTIVADIVCSSYETQYRHTFGALPRFENVLKMIQKTIGDKTFVYGQGLREQAQQESSTYTKWLEAINGIDIFTALPDLRKEIEQQFSRGSKDFSDQRMKDLNDLFYNALALKAKNVFVLMDRQGKSLEETLENEHGPKSKSGPRFPTNVFEFCYGILQGRTRDIREIRRIDRDDMMKFLDTHSSQNPKSWWQLGWKNPLKSHQSKEKNGLDDKDDKDEKDRSGETNGKDKEGEEAGETGDDEEDAAQSKNKAPPPPYSERPDNSKLAGHIQSEKRDLHERGNPNTKDLKDMGTVIWKRSDGITMLAAKPVNVYLSDSKIEYVISLLRSNKRVGLPS